MAEKAAAPNVASLPSTNKVSLRELANFFLRLGITAFGGPAAHTGMMEGELVRRRQWLSREKFLDLLGASNLMPGPSSSELAIHIGYLLAGWAGLLVAGTCFILPAAMMVAAPAWAYVHFGKLPEASAIPFGVKPVVVAVILQALWGLGRTAVKTAFLGVVGTLSLLLAFLGLHPLLVLALAGSAVCLTSLRSLRLPVAAVPFAVPTAALAGAATSFSLGSLLLVFLKVGAAVFGSGYVLLAFLRADLVVHRGWVTDSQLVDAIAVGQVTPGPVFTTATFIGYLLGGIPGAVVATVGIFLPAFLLVAVSGPLVPRIRKSKIASAFLDGVNVGSLALMGAVTWELGRASLVGVVTVLLLVASLIALLRFRANSGWLVLIGAIVGLITNGFHPRW
jgi:chromate transporter